jgi:L-iditol 2-dehydrogenase
MEPENRGPNPAAVLHGVGTVVMEQRPIPALDEDAVLIEVGAVGICGSDVHYFRHGRIGSYVVESPLVLGHETAGTVVEVGAKAEGLEVGDRVAIEPGRTCGRCDECRSGAYNLCARVEFHGTPPIDGTLQRFVAVPADLAFRLPADMTIEQGALVEPLAVAVWACRKAGVTAGQRVLITGAGPVGLLALQTARAFGAGHVAVTDLDLQKADLSKRLGADEFVDAAAPEALSDGYDVHIECSGSVAAARAGIERLAPRGIAVLVGMGDASDLGIQVSVIQQRELRITGIFRYANCYPTAIELIASGRVVVDELITGRYPLAEAAEALDASGRNGAIKNLVLPER